MPGFPKILAKVNKEKGNDAVVEKKTSVYNKMIDEEEEVMEEDYYGEAEETVEDVTIASEIAEDKTDVKKEEISPRSNPSDVEDLDHEEEANLIETLETKNLEIATTTTFKILQKKGAINFGEIIGHVASKVLAAYLGFRDPKKRRREYLIPKDKAAWLEWLVSVATKRITVEYLTDKELRKVIIRARPNLAPFKPKFPGPVEDPDLPPCITWNEEQVGDWIASVGWPNLRETFIKNKITGRRLVLIDCSALNSMGMQDLASMKDVAGKIRDLLGLPPPNGIRPIMRVPPYERFLRRKVYNGRSYDEITFEKFCEMEGYNYEFISTNKNAQIPCTTEVLITTPEKAEDEDGEGGESDEEHSLKNAPTVEFLVRNALVRNKLVDQLMEDILENVFLPPKERRYGKEVWGSLKRGIGEGFDDLYLYYPQQRLEFASGVAHSLIEELYKTVAIMNDINQLERHIKENITDEDLDLFRKCAQKLIEEAVPIAALLALGELDLESIFKQDPQFEKFVNDIIRKAERKTNEAVPDASRFVDEVITAALKQIPKMDLKDLNPELRGSLIRMTEDMLGKINKDTEQLHEHPSESKSSQRRSIGTKEQAPKVHETGGTHPPTGTGNTGKHPPPGKERGGGGGVPAKGHRKSITPKT